MPLRDLVRNKTTQLNYIVDIFVTSKEGLRVRSIHHACGRMPPAVKRQKKAEC